MPVPFIACNLVFQLSSLTSPLGILPVMSLSGPINTPRNFTVTYDFVLLSTMCKLLSALEVDGLNIKCALGPIIT